MIDMPLLCTQMVRLCRRLDQAGKHGDADAVANVLERVSQISTNQFNVPIQDRVIPWDNDFQGEMDDVDQKRQNDTRYHPEYYSMNSGDTDEEKDASIFSLNGPDDVPGPASIQYDPHSPGADNGDMTQFEWSTREKNDNAADRYKNLLPN